MCKKVRSSDWFIYKYWMRDVWLQNNLAVGPQLELRRVAQLQLQRRYKYVQE